MKKIFLAILLVLAFVSQGMCVTALYRISSGEILLIDQEDPYDGPGENYARAIITDATYPDGYNLQRRVLGEAKILDGTVVRNATQGEIDGFAAAELDDRRQQQAEMTLEYLRKNPKIRRLFMSLARLLKKEFNILRSKHGLPDRTLEQFKNAMEDNINKND